MTITVHHLGISQSERIVWLMEELGLPYKLEIHTRAPIMSPESLKSVPGNDTGKSPFVVDSDTGVTLSESAAICEYIVNMYGDDKLTVSPKAGAKQYADYLYWFHYANGTLQPEAVGSMFVSLTGVPDDNMIAGFSRQRMAAAWELLDERLKDNKWLAGDEFTLADIMTLYTVTTQRYWGPRDDLSKHKSLVRWVKDCTARPAYQKAMEKGDPKMKILNDGPAPQVGMFESGGTESTHWHK